jgi:protein-disulfide isomerase
MTGARSAGCYGLLVIMSSLSDPVPPVDPRDHVRGAAAPVVTLIEYGDYECPHTRAAQAVVDQLLQENADLRIVFRHFPQRRMHPRAEMLARAAEAAHAQGHFWKMHDDLMARQRTLDERGAIAAARALGLDPARMQNDIGGRVVIAAVERHAQGALRCGVVGTPTFFFEGSMHHGSYDYATLREKLDDAWARTTGPKSRLSMV